MKIRNIIYSGSHGQKVYFPNGDRHEEAASDTFLTISKAIADEMKAKVNKSITLLLYRFKKLCDSNYFNISTDSDFAFI